MRNCVCAVPFVCLGICAIAVSLRHPAPGGFTGTVIDSLEDAPDPESLEYSEAIASEAVDLQPWETNPSARRDSANYVFQLPRSEEKPHCGFQEFGSMDKLGVDASVNAEFTESQGDFSHIFTQKAQREVFLAEVGHPQDKADRKWNVRVWAVREVGTQQRYVVTAEVGVEVAEAAPDGTVVKRYAPVVYELWLMRDGDSPELLERTLDAAVSGAGRTTAEIDADE